MKKAQLFSMDALLSVMGITIVLGLLSTQLTVLFDQYTDAAYEKLEMISSDMNNIAVSNTMIHVFGDGTSRPAVVDRSAISAYRNLLENTFAEEYSGQIRAFGDKTDINGGCLAKRLQASNKRVVMDFNSKVVSWLELTVCYNEQ